MDDGAIRHAHMRRDRTATSADAAVAERDDTRALAVLMLRTRWQVAVVPT